MKKETLAVISELGEVFVRRGLRLSVAESCTGGLISHYLTSLPGSSRFFLAGVVSYSSDSKIRILGVSAHTIEAHGVISRETAKEMAEKIRTSSGSHFSVSTTGNLGPDVLESKEKGLIYTAVSWEGGTSVRELRVRGERLHVREKAALTALKFLCEMVTRV